MSVVLLPSVAARNRYLLLRKTALLGDAAVLASLTFQFPGTFPAGQDAGFAGLDEMPSSSMLPVNALKVLPQPLQP